MNYLGIKDFIKRFVLFFLCYGNKKKFIRFIKNKSVAVVGNASSIFSHDYGKEIDSHDIVIRFNNGYIKQTSSQGSKTSIWATSFYIPEKDLYLKFPDIQQIIWLSPKMSLIKNGPVKFLGK